MNFFWIPHNHDMEDFANFANFWCHRKSIKLSYDVEII
jgi:hypothetical protein